MGYDSISPLGPNPEALKVGHLILLNQKLNPENATSRPTNTTTMKMSSTANMLLSELRTLQERRKREDEELQWRMEEAEEQEVERRREEERAEAEQKAAEAEEVQRAMAGKKRKAAGSIDEDGSEAPEGFAKGEPCYLCRKAEIVGDVGNVGNASEDVRSKVWAMTVFPP